MKKIRIILFFCLLGILLSCGNKATNNNNDAQTISISPQEALESINLSEIADSVSCIRLKTDSTDVMGTIRQIIIRDKYIYAIDISLQQVLVFDKKGNFVSKLSKYGEGPDEYLVLGPVFIDPAEQFMDIIDIASDKILRYSNISFDLIKQDTFPDVKFNSCRRTQDSLYYFATQQLDNIINDKETNAELLILGKEKNFNLCLEKKIETNRKYFSPASECFTQNEQGNLFYSPMYGNTFYQLKGTELIPLYNIDFGKYAIAPTISLASTEKQMEYIYNMDEIASYPVLNMNNNDKMIFSYYFKSGGNRNMFRKDDIRHYIRDKKNNHIYHTKKIKNDLTVFPENIYLVSYFGCVHEVFYKDYFIDIVMPYTYLESIGKEEVYANEIGKVTMDDDPIVIMMKMKL